MSEYYPGSRKPRKDYAGKDKEVVDQEETDILLDFKPKVFLVNGKPVPLYPLGVLAKALNRQPVTIRKLESEGFIPKATLILPSHDSRGTRRLYTMEQIAALRRIAAEEGILEPNANGKWKPIEGTKFREKAMKAFREN